MREIRQSGSEGGAAETNRPSLPLFKSSERAAVLETGSDLLAGATAARRQPSSPEWAPLAAGRIGVHDARPAAGLASKNAQALLVADKAFQNSTHRRYMIDKFRSFRFALK